MRCERCQGTGLMAVRLGLDQALHPMFEQALCDDCQGSGISYCCDDSGVNPPNSFDLEHRNRMWGRYINVPSDPIQNWKWILNELD